MPRLSLPDGWPPGAPPLLDIVHLLANALERALGGDDEAAALVARDLASDGRDLAEELLRHELQRLALPRRGGALHRLAELGEVARDAGQLLGDVAAGDQ